MSELLRSSCALMAQEPVGVTGFVRQEICALIQLATRYRIAAGCQVFQKSACAEYVGIRPMPGSADNWMSIPVAATVYLNFSDSCGTLIGKTGGHTPLIA